MDRPIKAQALKKLPEFQLPQTNPDPESEAPSSTKKLFSCISTTEPRFVNHTFEGHRTLSEHFCRKLTAAGQILFSNTTMARTRNHFLPASGSERHGVFSSVVAAATVLRALSLPQKGSVRVAGWQHQQVLVKHSRH